MDLPIKLKLPEHFLEEEFRCGYKVITKLKKIWAVELDLLNEFQRVCKKHDIKYTAFGGTLLGAVRHQGFIPWDDDLDVALTRHEFDKLCSVAEKEFENPYYFQTAISDRRFFLPFARLRNSKTTAIINGQSDRNYNNGIYIDIYVLEGYADSKVRWMCQNVLLKLLVKSLTLYYQDTKRNNSIKEIALRVLRPFVRLFAYETLYSAYKKVLGMYTAKSKRIGLRDEMSEQAKRYWLYKDEMDEMDEMPFEFLKVPNPRRYDAILSRIYGDYMMFPAVAVRGTWHNGQINFDPDLPYTDYLKMANSHEK